MRKVYYLKAKKKTYIEIATSTTDMRDCLDVDKKYFDLNFGIGGHFEISLAEDIEIKNIAMLDHEHIDHFELYDHTLKREINEDFITIDAL